MNDSWWYEHRERWFGTSWGAPVCDPEDRCEVPVGKFCGRCGEVIRKTDQGIDTHLVSASDGTSRIAYHLDCFLKKVLPCEGCERCKPGQSGS